MNILTFPWKLIRFLAHSIAVCFTVFGVFVFFLALYTLFNPFV